MTPNSRCIPGTTDTSRDGRGDVAQLLGHRRAHPGRQRHGGCRGRAVLDEAAPADAVLQQHLSDRQILIGESSLAPRA